MKIRDTRLHAISLILALTTSLLVASSTGHGSNNVRLLVGFSDTPDVSIINKAGGTVHRVFKYVPAMAVSVPEQAILGLRQNPKIEYVEVDREIRAIYTSGETIPWGLTRINAPAVYAGGNSGNGIKVAVLDTGIDINHPDLVPNYMGGHDYVNDDSIPNDDNGHGTHVSGIIAAADNNTGMVGVGPQIDLYSLKILNEQGNGYLSDGIAAFEWAIDNNIDVINMSYGGPDYSRTEEKEMNKAYNAGILLVAAAGNDYNSTTTYPAAYSSVIAVAATDSSNNHADFSNYFSDVELAAPGVGVYSTMPTYTVYLNTQYGYATNYAYLSGTSMATPYVSGTAALVFAQHPTWTNVQVRNQLSNTVTDLGTPGRDVYFGYGLINAQAACAVPAVTGIITLSNWSGTPTGMSATIDLRNGSGVTVETKNVTLGSNGGFSFTTSLNGSFTAVAKAGHWLAKAMPLTITDGSGTVNFTLRNGDCNGDNGVDEVDYALLSNSWYQAVGDPAYNAQADLNGDGGVDEIDYAILSNSWYTFGD